MLPGRRKARGRGPATPDANLGPRRPAGGRGNSAPSPSRKNSAAGKGGYTLGKSNFGGRAGFWAGHGGDGGKGAPSQTRKNAPPAQAMPCRGSPPPGQVPPRTRTSRRRPLRRLRPGALDYDAGRVGGLRKYLPNRYAVAQGIVVDSNGATSDQIDIIIFDPQYTPTLLDQQSHRFVPAEAVYGVLEAKPVISKQNLEYAGDKAASVR